MPIKAAPADRAMPTIVIGKNAKDLSGVRAGRLRVVRPVEVDKHRNVIWECECDCGTWIRTAGHRLLSEGTKSCGCLHLEKVTTHRQSASNSTRSYRIWQGIQQRCHNPSNPDHPNYGGRGIVVCERWRESYENFFEDMRECPSSKHSIDRIDNDGPYSPDNCRWATKKEQDRNKRSNRVLEWGGLSMCLTEWSEFLDINAVTFWARVDKWGIERAVTTPYKGRVPWPPEGYHPMANLPQGDPLPVIRR